MLGAVGVRRRSCHVANHSSFIEGDLPLSGLDEAVNNRFVVDSPRDRPATSRLVE